MRVEGDHPPRSSASLTQRRQYLLAALGSLAGGLFQPRAAVASQPALPSCSASAKSTWADWLSYKSRFIQSDGRVIDFSTPEQQSTSEGQVYTLFFALVANDRAIFERVLAWTQSNLAGNDLTARLPAWKWGRRPDNTWGVLDPNGASDADLWLAYTLLEAARYWQEPRYAALGSSVMALIEKKLFVTVPGLGIMLLPGEQGFKVTDKTGLTRWRFNPSYLPPFKLRYFSAKSRSQSWIQLEKNSLTLLRQTTQQGYAADWVTYQVSATGEGQWLAADTEKGPIGSYDAIRVYSWLGMSAGLWSSREKQQWLQLYRGMQQALQTNLAPPRLVNLQTGQQQEEGGVGFSAALLPYLSAWPEARLLAQQQTRIEALWDGSPARVQSWNYYDAVLLLFGRGWLEKRFRFQRDGALQLRGAC
ncbi:cellulose synthase complex periplasmic endoglucanase BcsZ [Parvibium lacunae]|uniref:cellulase n=1 Tax=Parvibium lacunae TaxID=1888893 RepID=A0A368L814_9BURK|nr:cellulose synthase complex periplasmic endoglucanase BcsZ [Parvibium lacunae]RCS59805.1 cellulase [Parvibium lacunae]